MHGDQDGDFPEFGIYNILIIDALLGKKSVNCKQKMPEGIDQ